jgi:hypothetical protein
LIISEKEKEMRSDIGMLSSLREAELPHNLRSAYVSLVIFIHEETLLSLHPSNRLSIEKKPVA